MIDKLQVANEEITVAYNKWGNKINISKWQVITSLD